MLEWLRSVDHQLFHKINGVWTHPVLDSILPYLTDLHQSKPLVFGALPVALLWFVYAKRKEAVTAILAAALAVGATDALNHRVVKPAFARARPSIGILRSPRHSGYSFPSNHAANVTAAAVVLRAASPAVGLGAAVVAFVVCYSRVYVGVHYPSDVIAGALFGALVGRLVVLLFRRLKLLKK